MDGIERDLESRARVIRLSALSDVGAEIARRYDVHSVPTLLVFDGQGRAVGTWAGMPDRQGIVEQVNALLPPSG